MVVRPPEWDAQHLVDRLADIAVLAVEERAGLPGFVTEAAGTDGEVVVLEVAVGDLDEPVWRVGRLQWCSGRIDVSRLGTERAAAFNALAGERLVEVRDGAVRWAVSPGVPLDAVLAALAGAVVEPVGDGLLISTGTDPRGDLDAELIWTPMVRYGRLTEGRPRSRRPGPRGRRGAGRRAVGACAAVRGRGAHSSRSASSRKSSGTPREPPSSAGR